MSAMMRFCVVGFAMLVSRAEIKALDRAMRLLIDSIAVLTEVVVICGGDLLFVDGKHCLQK